MQFSSVVYSIETDPKTKEVETDLAHASCYIGPHAYTPEYSFQEALRKNDLGIKKSLEQLGDSKGAEQFFINGWGQIIGALVALKKHKINAEFSNVIDENIDTAVEKGRNKTNPFMVVNVREQAKNMMMYPHQGKYLPWRRVHITKPIALLNTALKKHSAQFSLYEGKCYLHIGQKGEHSIFTELWASDFATLLKKQGYRGLEPNKEHPHITLINSNVVAAVKDKFSEKYGAAGQTRFSSFMNSWIDEANSELSKENHAIEFTQLDSIYSEDYSPFEEVVVAKLQAPKVKKALNILVNKAKEEVDYTLAVKDEDSLHLTIATRYRNPNDFSATTIEQIINSCPKKSRLLSGFLQEFKKQLNILKKDYE